MIYFIIFAFSFLFGIWVKVSGEVIKLELGNYIISIDRSLTALSKDVEQLS